MRNSKIKELVQKIQPINQDVFQNALEKFDQLTKPRKSLGKLEDLVARAAGIYGLLNPDLSRKVIFLMASDHGVTAESVSAYPSEITRQMVLNFLSGGAAINVLAHHFAIEVVVTDMGVKGDLKTHTGLINKKMAQGTSNMTIGPAMSREMAEESILRGYHVFEETFAQKKIGIIGLGEMGIGNTTASSAIISVLTGEKIEHVVDRGTGLKPKQVQHKINIIKQALKVNQPNPADPIDVLSKVGGFEIGGLVGCILAASAHKIPVVMDGFISAACGLLAVKVAPLVGEYLFASHYSKEKGHHVALSHLGKFPMFNLEMRLGEGTGAVFGIKFLEAGFELLNQMATFDQMQA